MINVEADAAQQYRVAKTTIIFFIMNKYYQYDTAAAVFFVHSPTP